MVFIQDLELTYIVNVESIFLKERLEEILKFVGHTVPFAIVHLIISEKVF